MRTTNTHAVILAAQKFINAIQQEHRHVTDLHVGRVEEFFTELAIEGAPRNPRVPINATVEGVEPLVPIKKPVRKKK